MTSISGAMPPILALHVEEITFLWHQRERLVEPSRVTLTDLSHMDNRILAHLDGLRVAVDGGWHPSTAPLEGDDPGAVFAVTVPALEMTEPGSLSALLSAVEHAPAMHAGLTSALGWTSSRFLRGTVKSLLTSPSVFRRRAGVACCAMHGVDPKGVLDQMIGDASPLARATAFRASAAIGRLNLKDACTAAIADDDPECRHHAASAAVLLGNRTAALEALVRCATTDGLFRAAAFSLALQVLSVRAGHQLLQEHPDHPDRPRREIEGSGLIGNPAYVPWLITQMRAEGVARLAAEAFATVVGDLAALGPAGEPPSTGIAEPTDDPGDPNVVMNPDDGLPWPDVKKIEAWWAANGSRFQTGQRYFMGAPVTREHCIDVLKNGCQRQRILAAHYLCLLEPGTPLFNTSAPAWRQQRLLATMT